MTTMPKPGGVGSESCAVVPESGRGDTPAHRSIAGDQHSCEVVAAAADCILAECAALVEEVPDVVYSCDSVTLRGGTIGKHLRHVVDHFLAAVGGDSQAESVIDYDNRLRNVPMESSRAVAIREIEAARARVNAVRACAAIQPVRVRIMISRDGASAELSSTLAREIAFATHHAIHHQAMMRAIAGEFGIAISDAFGKAPSTLHAQGCRLASLPQ